MAVDFSETDKHLILEADVPGFSSKDLNVELEDSVLTISGQKEDTQEKESKTYHLQERSASQFSRSFALPAYADLDKIECRLKEGKLTVQIGKTKEDSQKKNLSIKWDLVPQQNEEFRRSRIWLALCIFNFRKVFSLPIYIRLSSPFL